MGPPSLGVGGKKSGCISDFCSFHSHLVLLISSLSTQEGIRVRRGPQIYFLIGPEMC